MIRIITKAIFCEVEIIISGEKLALAGRQCNLLPVLLPEREREREGERERERGGEEGERLLLVRLLIARYVALLSPSGAFSLDSRALSCSLLSLSRSLSRSLILALALLSRSPPLALLFSIASLSLPFVSSLGLPMRGERERERERLREREEREGEREAARPFFPVVSWGIWWQLAQRGLSFVIEKISDYRETKPKRQLSDSSVDTLEIVLIKNQPMLYIR